MMRNERRLTDIVEVVRCEHYKYYHEGVGWCEKHSYYGEDEWKMFHKDDFCSYGELKDKKEEWNFQ